MALSAPVLEAIAAFGQAGHRVDLSVDGGIWLRSVRPRTPTSCKPILSCSAGSPRPSTSAGLAPYTTTPPPPGFGFYDHPDWLLIDRDDALIAKYGLTKAGFGHSTEKVIRGANDGLPIEAFIHRWKTQRTETYADSNGRTQTRTVTDNHSEALTAITMPFSFPLISVGGGWGGKKVRFESEDFNDRVTVRTEDAKFASDVIHPRTMEFLMAGSRQAFGSRAM